MYQVRQGYIVIGALLLFVILVSAGSFRVRCQDRVDKTIYKVVMNHEEQYSIWPAHKENPLGWKDEGKVGTKEECLAYIKEVWLDMRPLSLRKKMEMEENVLGDRKETPKPDAVTEAKPATADKNNTAVRSDTSPKLDADAVAELLEDLKSSLPSVAGEDAAAAIIEKWDARDDLAGETKMRIFELLFEDVKAVVPDEKVRKAIRSSWQTNPAP